MATVTKGKTFSTNETVTNTKIHQLVDSATISGIVTADISDSQITAAKLAADAVETAKIKDANVTTDKIADDAVDADKLAILTTKGDILGYSTEPARQAVGTDDEILVADSTEATGVKWKTATEAGIGGIVAQVVNTQTGDVATGSTAIPYDDTIPQNDEGDEYMTLAITPNSDTNKLKIEVTFIAAVNTPRGITVALFQDSTSNALAAVQSLSDDAYGETITFTHYMTAGTTSATTFKVRAGTTAGDTVTFNGLSAGRKFGGVMASSITITEITA